MTGGQWSDGLVRRGVRRQGDRHRSSGKQGDSAIDGRTDKRAETLTLPVKSTYHFHALNTRICIRAGITRPTRNLVFSLALAKDAVYRLRSIREKARVVIRIQFHSSRFSPPDPERPEADAVGLPALPIPLHQVPPRRYFSHTVILDRGKVDSNVVPLEV